jgi:hypothetical protein
MPRNFKMLGVAVIAVTAVAVTATAAASANAPNAGLADLPASEAQRRTAVNP